MLLLCVTAAVIRTRCSLQGLDFANADLLHGDAPFVPGTDANEPRVIQLLMF